MKRKNLLSFMLERQFNFRAIIILIWIVLGLNIHMKAQIFERLSNPQISVHMTHPPGLGLTIKKVAFGPATGTCANQIVDALINDFVGSNITVIDRENLRTILSEHSFTLSGSVDQSQAAAIGKILGPSVLIFVNVIRCATETKRLYDTETRYNSQTKTNYKVYAYYAQTKAYLKVSVRTVDLASGRIFSAQTLDYAPEKSNKSYEGYPEYPASFEVQENAFKLAVNDVHKMYLPWTEFRNLYFYDDKDFNLKQAFQALKDGNSSLAFSLSKNNLEACKNDSKVKEKILGRANYNLGMCYMIRNEHDSALKYFYEADRLKSGSIVEEAIADCKRAQSLRESMLRVEQRAIFETKQTEAAEEKIKQTESTNTLTNASVMEMVKLNLFESIIIQKIKTSKCKFETTPEALSTLTKSGVSEKVIMAMIEKL